MTDFELRRAENLRDAMTMRRIRNECRLFMTRDQTWIGVLRQAIWWMTLDKSVLPYIFQAKTDDGPKTIGYGLVAIAGDAAWLTGGLAEKFRGHGYGKDLFKALLREAKRTGRRPTLEVLRANVRARELYRSLGFETVSRSADVQIMEVR